MTHPAHRRQFLKGCVGIAAGATFGMLSDRAGAVQMLPAPQPSSDKRFSFVSTTEAAPWQSGSVFKQPLDAMTRTIKISLLKGLGKPTCPLHCFPSISYPIE